MNIKTHQPEVSNEKTINHNIFVWIKRRILPGGSMSDDIFQQDGDNKYDDIKAIY